jgi:hypothetical protein
VESKHALAKSDERSIRMLALGMNRRITIESNGVGTKHGEDEVCEPNMRCCRYVLNVAVCKAVCKATT